MADDSGRDQQRPKNGRATVHDVAKAAGVSINTISRVVNGRANVSPETAAKVVKAIAEVGYRPNLVARSLRLGRHDAIGLSVPSITDPFFAEVVTAIEETARERDFSAIISCTREDANNEETIVSSLLNRQVAGLIMVPTGVSQVYLAARYAGTPVVCVDRPPVGINCDCVLVDNEGGAYVATKWLVAHGHSRVGFVGGPHDQFTTNLRRDGYRRALADSGIEYDPDLVADSAILPSEVSRAVPALLALEDPITAIFTSNSKASLGVLDALHSSGRTDVAMVGFDDFPMANAVTPPTTVVSQDPYSVGREAVELLLHRIAGESDTPGQIVLPTNLICRGSGELRPKRPSRSQL